MQYLFLGLVSLIGFGGSLEAIQLNSLLLDAYSPVHFRFAECRQNLSQLTDTHSKVLNQYDLFAKTLKDAHRTGDLTENEIYQMIDALEFAADKHREQKRKDPDKTPYVIHLIGVAHHMMNVGQIFDTDILIAGLLHDTVEDTQTRFDEIELRFGKRIEGFVREVTDDKSLTKTERKHLQIQNAPHKSAGAAQIKLADKWYNLRDLLQNPPPDWDKERIDAYFDWAKSVVDALPKVNNPLKDAVDDVILAYWLSQE